MPRCGYIISFFEKVTVTLYPIPRQGLPAEEYEVEVCCAMKRSLNIKYKVSYIAEKPVNVLILVHEIFDKAKKEVSSTTR